MLSRRKVFLVTRIFSQIENRTYDSAGTLSRFRSFSTTRAEVLLEGGNPHGVAREVRAGEKRSFFWMRYEKLSSRESKVFADPNKGSHKSSSRTTSTVSCFRFARSLARRKLRDRMPTSGCRRTLLTAYALYRILDNTTCNCIRLPAVFSRNSFSPSFAGSRSQLDDSGSLVNFRYLRGWRWEKSASWQVFSERRKKIKSTSLADTFLFKRETQIFRPGSWIFLCVFEINNYISNFHY